MSEISDFVRRTFGESDTKRDAGLTTPHDVERFDDIVYGDDPKCVCRCCQTKLYD